jgi:NAD(P)-dependent dehydrogenase (short-subunit alcohol dehydrogenase family)
MNVVNKTVVITGSSSGIGRACTLRLVQAGWLVFTCVRKRQDGAHLQAEAGTPLVPVMMDVKDRASIIEAAKQVTNHLMEEDWISLM